MKIYYLGEPGAYSHIASTIAQKKLCEGVEIENLPSVGDIWNSVSDGNLGIIAIENSYAGSVHENLYNFLRYDFKIIGEVSMEINHCFLSKENDLNNVKKVFAHQQSLSQCYNFLKKHSIEGVAVSSNGTAAKMVGNSDESGIGAISSDLSAEIYGLNILEKGFQDQKGNTTRFFIIALKDETITYPDKKNKVTILFETKNIPAALYKCLGSFATNSINLSKIESLPSLKDPFSYMFWLDFEGMLEQENVKEALKELQFFTKSFKILGDY